MRGDLTAQDGAEMEGATLSFIQNLVWAKKTGKPTGGHYKKAGPKARTANLEGLVAEFTKSCEEFAAEVIKRTNVQLLKDLEDRDSQLFRLREYTKSLELSVAELKKAAKAADAGRSHDILRRAGVVHGE